MREKKEYSSDTKNLSTDPFNLVVPKNDGDHNYYNELGTIWL